MEDVLEVIRYKERNIYVKDRRKRSSFYANFEDIQQLVIKKIDFTFYDNNKEWTEEQLMTRVILSKESPSKSNSQILNKIIRHGCVRSYIEMIENKN